MIHQILPVKERVSQILPNSSPTCTLCRAGQPESILHALFSCDFNREAARHLLDLTRIYDNNITKEKMVQLQINCEALYELPTTLVVCSGLELIWRNRHARKETRLYDIRAELECLVLLLTLRKARPRKLREASSMINNTLNYL